MSVAIRHLRPDDPREVDRAVEALARSLMQDPLHVSMFPSDGQRTRALRWIVRRDLERALESGFVLVDEDVHAVNIVIRNAGLYPEMSRLARLRRTLSFARAVRFDPRALWRVRQDTRSRRVHELEDTSELHRNPHFYFALHGVDPDFQGRGLGSAIEHAALAISDEAGLPSRAGTNSQANVGLYERFGWRIVAELRVPGGPTTWLIMRPAPEASSSQVPEPGDGAGG